MRIIVLLLIVLFLPYGLNGNIFPNINTITPSEYDEQMPNLARASMAEKFDITGTWEGSWEYPASTVAILDTGIDPSHEVFYGKDIIFQDFIGRSYSEDMDLYSEPVDLNGHGTYVASVIAGQPENNYYYNNITVRKDGGGFYIDNPGEVEMTLRWYDIDNRVIEIFKEGIKIDTLDFSGSFGINSIYLVPGSYSIFTRSGQFELIVEIKMDSDSFRGMSSSRIISLKVLDDDGLGTSSSVNAALDWLIINYHRYNITVVNLSFNFDESIPVMDTRLDSLTLHGMVLVASAGTGKITTPASAQNVITVGAVTSNLEIASYSAISDDKPEIYALGGDPSSLFNVAESNNIVNNSVVNDYKSVYGTSISAAYVSATISIASKLMLLGDRWNWDIYDVYAMRGILKSTSYGNKSWGIINSKAVVTANNNSIIANTPYHFAVDSGGPTTLGFRFSFEAHVEYNISLYYSQNTVSHLYMFNSEIQELDRLHYFHSTYTSLGINIQFSTVQSMDKVIIAQVNSSIHDVIDMTVIVNTKNYIPSIQAYSSIINTTATPLIFQSSSGIAALSINGSYIGYIQNGYIMKNLNNSVYNITLFCDNHVIGSDSYGLSDVVSFYLVVDLDVPILDYNVPSFVDSHYSLKVDSNEIITYKYYLSGNLISAVSNFKINLSIQIEPYTYLPGTYELHLFITDIAGNGVLIENTIDFNHTNYLIGEKNITIFINDIDLSWVIELDLMANYTLYLNGIIVTEYSFSTESIIVRLKLQNGINLIILSVFTYDVGYITDFIEIVVVDVLRPNIISHTPDKNDIYNDFYSATITDPNLNNIYVYINDSQMLKVENLNSTSYTYAIGLNLSVPHGFSVDIIAIDTDGNKAVFSQTVQYLDLTLPSLQYYGDSYYILGSVNTSYVEWSYHDSYLSVVNFSINGALVYEFDYSYTNITQDTFRYLIPPMPDDTYNLTFYVSDRYGNYVQSIIQFEMISPGLVVSDATEFYIAEREILLFILVVVLFVQLLYWIRRILK